jgi:hypothetical protein
VATSSAASSRTGSRGQAGLERLVHYCATPSFALERLHALDRPASLASADSRLLYRFPKPDVHGRSELLLTPLELLERLARCSQKLEGREPRSLDSLLGNLCTSLVGLAQGARETRSRNDDEA